MATWWNSAYVTAVARKALKDSLVEEAELIGAVSQRYAARKTGAMRGTARIDDTDDTVVRIVYGGESATYAAIQHEHKPYKNPTTPGTEPKYLKIGFDGVVRSQLPTFLARVQANTRRRMRAA